MNVQLNREIKAYCPDFAPVRDIFRQHGAFYEETEAR